ncbi:uncharacterized protein LOC131095525 [Melospiza georgiana]|uniref:uncharacterized protein LOC131095525 n=1 Tax=Melospiza georgiana TaxID=44398 RepID=UPI0025AB8535|nr:uncharacterized protein LOC131095525 [Melospiza georgiana]
MVVPGRQEDGASLEQLLDHGWKRVGQGNRLWQPRDPPGPAAPSAPLPVPRGAPWRTRHRSSALRGHRAPLTARQRRGHRAPLYRDTALPCESHSARIPPLRVRIPGGSPPNDRGWGRCSRCGCTQCGPGGGQKPPKGWQPSRPLGSAGGAVPAACRTHVPVWAPGYRDSAGTDTAEALPVAPQPGAALNRHTEIAQPRQTPPTAQKDPEEQRALPGMEARAVCRGAQTAVPVSDLPELPHSSQIWNPKQYTWEMPQNQRFKRDEVWNFPGSQLKCRSEGKLLQVGPTGGVLKAGTCIPFMRGKNVQRLLLKL